MPRRQDREEHVVTADEQRLRGVADVGEHVVVRQHHAFRIRGCAAGVDDRQQVARLDGVARGLQFPRATFELLAAATQQLSERRGAVEFGGFGHHRDALERRQPRLHREHLARRVFVFGEAIACAAVLQDELHLRQRRVRAAGHARRADARERLIDQNPLVAVLRHDGDAVTAADAEVQQRRRERVDVRQQAQERDRLGALRAATRQEHPFAVRTDSLGLQGWERRLGGL